MEALLADAVSMLELKTNLAAVLRAEYRRTCRGAQPQSRSLLRGRTLVAKAAPRLRPNGLDPPALCRPRTRQALSAAVADRS